MSDKLLFTPGPLTTSAQVKQAMLRDLGSRDVEFMKVVREVRARLVAVAEARPDEYTAVIVQGSGTFGVESVLTTAVPPDGKLLVLANGAYGQRMGQIARVARMNVEVVTFPEEGPVDPLALEAKLAGDPAVTQVAVVHCETTTGLFNPVAEIAAVCRKAGRQLVVDAMSSFGAVPLTVGALGIDYVVSSANKCIEGVPGFSFAVCKTATLAKTKGWARSLTLDLHAQWRGLEETGQFRFTPPTHALLAFHRALAELEAEGGVEGRAARYRRNREICLGAMRKLGFAEYLAPELQGWIITSFRYPAHPKFDFSRLYESLSARGFVIYPGKVSQADCFRIGHIGRIDAAQTEAMARAMEEVLVEMGVRS
jgi:2-aminoethylphosphonate-pyruvate transaminase